MDKNTAKQVRKQKHKQTRQQKGKKGGQPAESKLRAQQVHEEKAARDRELNLKQKKVAERKAISAQIKQLVEMNRIEHSDGEIGFNFVDDNNVQQIYVTEKIQDELVRGRLAIIKLAKSYEILRQSALQIKLLCVTHRVSFFAMNPRKSTATMKICTPITRCRMI